MMDHERPGDSSHKCPREGCEIRVEPGKLACRSDWYRVPRALRWAVLRAWRGGQGAGSPEHRHAMVAAIRAMNREG